MGAEGESMSAAAEPVSAPRRVRAPGRWRILLYPVAPLLALLLWHQGTTEGAPNVPTPGGVLESAQLLMTDGQLFDGVRISLIRVLTGFAVALLLGTTVGLLMGRIRVIRQVVDPLVEMVRPIAPIALVPLAILWFGTGGISAVAIIAYSAFFPIVLNVFSAGRDIDASLMNAARTFGVSRATVLTQVILPAIIPGLIVGARLGMGLAWASVIAAELSVGIDASANPGIGQLMLIFYQYEVNPNPIVVCMIAVGVLGLALDFILRQVSVFAMPWQR